MEKGLHGSHPPLPPLSIIRTVGGGERFFILNTVKDCFSFLDENWFDYLCDNKLFLFVQTSFLWKMPFGAITVAATGFGAGPFYLVYIHPLHRYN